MKYIKSIITITLIISSLTIFVPYYSYSFVGNTNSIGEKNPLELINKNIEPAINFVSSESNGESNGDEENLICLQDAFGKVQCLDEDDLDSTQIAQLLAGGGNIQCFDTKDGQSICLNQNNLNSPLNSPLNNPLNSPYGYNNNIQCLQTYNGGVVCFDITTGTPLGYQ